MTKPRTGQADEKIDRQEFHLRFYGSFGHPDFDKVSDALAQVEEVAWRAYVDGKKPARTEKAGPGFADPDYDLSVEWRENGGPPVVAPGHTGFGTVMIDRNPRLALGAEVEFGYPEEGFYWRLTAPIDRIAETRA